MATNLITPDSVNYLTPRLESNQLLDNSLPLELATGVESNTADQFPRVYSTGNIVVYLQGILQITATKSLADPLCYIPQAFGRLLLNEASLILPVAAVISGAYTIAPIALNVVDNQIVIQTYSETDLTSGDTVFLDGITFLTNISG